MKTSGLVALIVLLTAVTAIAPAHSVSTANEHAFTAFASQLTGDHDSCNLSTGLTASGTACADHTAALNAFLSTATENSPVRLIQDIGSLVKGLQLPATGHVTIECSGWDTGYFVAPGSNAHAIRNLPAPDGYSVSLAPGAPGRNVEIKNCRINGNRGNGTTGNANSGDARESPKGNWLFGIYLDNVQHVRVTHNWIYDAPTFGILCNACTDAVFDGNRLDAPSHQLNQDGIHVDGPSNQIRISNNWCNTPDDCIAMNAAEGYGGAIDGVSVTNNQCVECLTAYRQLSNEEGAMRNAAVRNVIISNYAGTLKDSSGIIAVALRLGEVHAGSTKADIMQTVQAANLSFSSESPDAYMIEIDDNLGTLDVNGLTWSSPRGANALLNFRAAASVSSASLRGIRIMRNEEGHMGAYLLKVPRGCAIQNLHLDGVFIENQALASYSPVSSLLAVPEGGEIANVDIGALDPTNILALASADDYKRIGRLRGAGLAATGFPVPDAIVPNLVPYISGTTPHAGTLCIKRNGKPVCL